MFTPEQLTISVFSEPQWERVALRGELDVATAGAVAETLNRLDAKERAIVVDLNDLTFLDSSGIAVLLKARANGERLTLICPENGIVARVLQIVHAGQVVPIFPDLVHLIANWSDGQPT